MTTILITGSNGQLGNEMQQAAVRFPDFKYQVRQHQCKYN